mgnify:CR=1 FL=1
MSDLSDEDTEAIEILTSKYGDKLSEWEENFLAILVEQEWISDKQQEIFDKLWHELTEHRGRR